VRKMMASDSLSGIYFLAASAQPGAAAACVGHASGVGAPTRLESSASWTARQNSELGYLSHQEARRN
jgi:hypothetical protein